VLNIEISARHMEITDSMRSYTNAKLGPMGKYLRSVSRLTVTFDSKSPIQHMVEVIAHIDNHENIIVKKEDKDFYACIDKVHDILEKRLTQIKEKSKDKRRQSSRSAAIEE